MTPSQRDEDLRAFEEWARNQEEILPHQIFTARVNTWHAALAWERERVKRETSTEKPEIPFHAQKWFPAEPHLQHDEGDAEEYAEHFKEPIFSLAEQHRAGRGFVEGRRTCACRNLTKEK